MMHRSRRFPPALALPALFLTLAIVGCESGVSGPEAVAFDEDAEFFLAESGASPAASPAERVGAAVRHAHAVLDRARTVVGDAPSADVAAHLAQAERACAAATEAHAAERWRVAITASMRCVHEARQAGLLSSAERRPDLEARAVEAHAAASDLVARASALVTPESPPMARRLLDGAETYLAEAQVALDRGQFRAALVRAVVAGTLARRIIQTLG
jgi:hypothetical protein